LWNRSQILLVCGGFARVIERSVFRKIQLILVMFTILFVLRTPVGKYPKERDIVFLEEGEHSIAEQVGGDKGVLPVIESGKRRLAVSIDEGLLIDSARTFDSTDVEGVPSAKTTRGAIRTHRGLPSPV